MANTSFQFTGGGHVPTTSRLFKYDASGTEYTWNGTTWVLSSTITTGDFSSLGVIALSTKTTLGLTAYVGTVPSGIAAATITAAAYDLTPVAGEHVDSTTFSWDGSQIVDLSALAVAVSELGDGSQGTPAGTDPLANLKIAYQNLSIAYANATANPKPTYMIGGQRINWQEYMESLQEQMQAIRQQISQEEVFELQTEGFSSY